MLCVWSDILEVQRMSEVDLQKKKKKCYPAPTDQT